MSYNAKNYAEQGGEVFHIGGKLVIDDGADISALVAALTDVEKASPGPLTETFEGKRCDEMIGEDVQILTGGVVVGTVKHLTGYTAFSGDEQNGHFFPVQLGDTYKEKTIKVKRTSGQGGQEKSEKDTKWVLRLTDEEDTVFTFTEDEQETPFLTLSFKRATLLPQAD